MSSNRRRVVVTGLGCVSPLGNSVPESWAYALAGRSGIGLITHFDASAFACRIAGEVKNLDISPCLSTKEARTMDTFVHYALVAALEAVRDAGLPTGEALGEEASERIGCVIGSGIGGLPMIENTHAAWVERGPRRISPFFVPASIINMVADALSTRNDDPQAASRPWDKDRDGFVLGEGAGIVVLEEYEHARKRGARIYAELAGFGMSADAGHMTAPTMDGPRRAMQSALRNAGINAEQIGYVNAHGTSTPLGDINETKAIKAAFGEHARNVVISSTKSMTGHLLGGAGGVESVFTILALHEQKVPPTINLTTPDPECDLDYCANTARDLSFDYAMKNNYGFGGTNGSLVFKRI